MWNKKDALQSVRKFKPIENYVRQYKVDDIKSQIDQFVKKHARLPQVCEFANINDLPSKNTAEKHLGMKILDFYRKTYSEYMSDENTDKNTDKNTEEAIKNKIRNFVECNGRLPKIVDYMKKNGLPSYGTAKKYLGNIHKFYQKNFSAYSLPSKGGFESTYTAEDVADKIRNFVDMNKRLPHTSDYGNKNNMPSYITAQKYLGNLQKYYQKNYPAYSLSEGGRYGGKYTVEKVTDKICNFVKMNRRLPRVADYMPSNGLMSYDTAKKYLGNLQEFYQKYYPRYPLSKSGFVVKYTAEEIANKICDFVKTNRRLPTSVDYVPNNGLPSYDTARKYLGDIREYYRKNYPTFLLPKRDGHSCMYTVQNVTNRIRTFVDLNGRLPRSVDYTPSNGLPSYDTAKKYLGNLQEFYQRYYPRYPLTQSGFVNKYTAEEIANKIYDFVQTNRRLPKTIDYVPNNGLPSYGTARRYLGDMQEFYQKNYPEYFTQEEEQVEEEGMTFGGM